MIKIKLLNDSCISNLFNFEILFLRYNDSFFIILFDFLICDLSLSAWLAAFCAKEFTLQGIFIFSKTINSLELAEK